MPIQLASFLVPKGTNTYYILEDKYIKGGLQIVGNVAERDAINPINKKGGMVVVTQDDMKLWQLSADKSTWSEFSAGGGVGPRRSIVHTVNAISALSYADFDLNLGDSVIVFQVSVDVPCQVEAFETSARTDTNPYKFIATTGHLSDDGSTTMSDGSTFKGRRYSILANVEALPNGKIYFRITNPNSINPINVNLTLNYLPLEL